MFAKLAIWYLRRKKCSILINYEIIGGCIKALGVKNYTYDNKLIGVDYRLRNGEKFDIQEGKFYAKVNL
jgi:hypothetical protein